MRIIKTKVTIDGNVIKDDDNDDIFSKLISWEYKKTGKNEVSELTMETLNNIRDNIDLTTKTDVLIEAGENSSTEAVIFRGFISSFKSQEGIIDITCKDKSWDLIRNNVNKIYNLQSVQNGIISEIAKDLITTAGFDYEVEDTGTDDFQKINEFICSNVSIFERLKILADLVNYTFYYNSQTDKIHFESIGFTENSTSLKTRKNIINIPKWLLDNDRIINDLRLDGGVIETTRKEPEIGSAIIGTTPNFDRNGIQLSRIPQSTKLLMDNSSIPTTIKKGSSERDSSAFYYIERESKTIRPIITNGFSQRAIVEYTWNSPIPIRVIDEDSIQKYGLFKKHIKLDEVRNFDDVEKRAENILQVYSEPFITGEMQIINDGNFKFGDKVRIIDDINRPNVDEKYAIISHTLMYPERIEKIKVGNEPLRLADWQFDIEERLKSLEDNLQKTGDDIILELLTENKNIKLRNKFVKVDETNKGLRYFKWGSDKFEENFFRGDTESLSYINNTYLTDTSSEIPEKYYEFEDTDTLINNYAVEPPWGNINEFEYVEGINGKGIKLSSSEELYLTQNNFVNSVDTAFSYWYKTSSTSYVRFPRIEIKGNDGNETLISIRPDYSLNQRRIEIDVRTKELGGNETTTVKTYNNIDLDIKNFLCITMSLTVSVNSYGSGGDIRYLNVRYRISVNDFLGNFGTSSFDVRGGDSSTFKVECNLNNGSIIDELRFFDESLSSNEHRELYNNGDGIFFNRRYSKLFPLKKNDFIESDYINYTNDNITKAKINVIGKTPADDTKIQNDVTIQMANNMNYTQDIYNNDLTMSTHYFPLDDNKDTNKIKNYSIETKDAIFDENSSDYSSANFSSSLQLFRNNYYLYFVANGNNSIRTYIELDSENDFTIMFYVRVPSSINSINNPNLTGASGDKNPIFGDLSSGSIGIMFDYIGRIYTYFGSGSVRAMSNSTIADTWTHVAITYQKNTNNKVCKIYINGILETTQNLSSNFSFTNNINNTIISSNSTTISDGRGFFGYLSEFRFYDISLDSSYVLKDYQNSSTQANAYDTWIDFDNNIRKTFTTTGNSLKYRLKYEPTDDNDIVKIDKIEISEYK